MLTFTLEGVTLTWKFHRADWFRGWRCNLVMNTEKVKEASLKEKCSVGLHAVQDAFDNLSPSVSLSRSFPLGPFVEHFVRVAACLYLRQLSIL